MKKPKDADAARTALKNLVAACGHVNLGAMSGGTVLDFRKVMKFMEAVEAAEKVLGTDRD